jgi:environmental stress-induced protein Ves
MTVLQHILVAAMPPQPWRNGGGSTRTLLTWPGGAGPWQLRISVADITRDGPFSAFDGVDRWFAVLQGVGVRLALPGEPEQVLRSSSAPLQFAGETAPGCCCIAGPTRDLNLMLQRGAGSALMQDATAATPWQHGAPLRALFTTAALQLHIAGAPPQAVAAWSLVLASGGAAQRWTIDHLPAGARALWLAYTPAGAA